MAFGFTPKFEQSLDLNGLNPEYYLVIALDAAKQLDWTINYISKSGFICIIGGGVFSSMERFTLTIYDTTVLLKSENVSSGMYDWGKNKKHVEDFYETFNAIQAILSEEELDEKVKEVMPPLLAQEEDALTAPPATAGEKIKSVLSFFTPREGYYITPIIININLLVFILMVLSGVSIMNPGTDSLLQWGANLRSATLGGQWWRLLTNVFLHIGIFHILFNMYALLYIGLLLEPYLGKLRFAAAYLFTGILASLTSIYWHPLTVSAGASGAIFGMYGVFLAMLTTNIIDKKTRSALFASIGVFVVFNLMNGVKAGIDNAAHIGGLLSGLVIGYAYYPSIKKPEASNLKYLTIGLLLVATLTTSFIMIHKIPNDVGKYDVKMNDFINNEKVALEVFKMKNASDAEILAALKDKGTANWIANLKILDDIDKLDIPQELKDRNAKLRQYCQLRIASYGYIYKAVDEKTELYKPSIDSCNKKIEAIINDLSGKK
ncbi:MAG TPA: rhomboid family intramembrane serine protease [Mucilaginibacter sp.]|nr:rhomboid family intramembrane serine protease [Mucilaginibacter sp.]